MVQVKDRLLNPCPFCNGQVELWASQTVIQCRFICKKCGYELDFKRGYDTEECVKRWNRRGERTKHAKPVVKEEPLSETMCMDAGPNQFKRIYYKPTCPHGCTDCIYDSMYIYSTYPKWYKKLYGDADPKTTVCDNCTNGERYDDEDK